MLQFEIDQNLSFEEQARKLCDENEWVNVVISEYGKIWVYKNIKEAHEKHVINNKNFDFVEMFYPSPIGQRG